MKKEICITFEWWNTENIIEDKYKEGLEEEAFNRIFPMIAEGYTSGELVSVVYDYDKDREIEYQGSWSLSTKTIEG